MLRAVTNGFIATTVVVWLGAYSRLSFLQTQSSRTAKAVESFSQSQGDHSSTMPWRSELSTFNIPHPLLVNTSLMYQVLQGALEAGKLPATARLECAAINALKERVRSLCVVGNGPLTEIQRWQISNCDVIMRFNQMNTRNCGERHDIWVVRHAGHVPLSYHGLNNTVKCGIGEAIDSTRSIWFIDGSYGDRRWDVTHALDQLPSLTEKMWMPLDTRLLRANYKALVDSKSLPSTGWLGMMLALQCAPSGSRVHLFGFNWSRKHWQAHRMASEERFARAMHAAGRIFIHWPVCDGLRNCNHCTEAAAAGKPVKGCSAAGKHDPAKLPWKQKATPTKARSTTA